MTPKSRRISPHDAGTAGFSLIEILVVVGIIGIIAATGAPPLMNYLRLYKIRGAQQQVLGEIQTARNKAISKNVNFGVVFVAVSPTTYRYVIEDDQTPPKVGVAVAVSTRINDPRQAGPLRSLPGGIVFGTGCPNFTANAPALRFNRLGTWCDPLTDSETCPAVDVGQDLLQNGAQGTRVCLVQTQTGLRAGVQVAPGGRARAEG